MKNSLLPFVTILFTTLFASAQVVDTIYGCDDFPLDPNAPPCTICSYSVVYGSTYGYTPSPSANWCGTIENDQYIGFKVNNSGLVSFQLSTLNCASGSGLQMAIYNSENELASFCEPMSSGMIQAPGLTPGEFYYLRIDGFAGDNCDFFLQAISGIDTGPPNGMLATPNVQVQSSPDTLCAGSVFTAVASSADEDVQYLWEWDDFSFGRITSENETYSRTFNWRLPPGECELITLRVTAIEGCGASESSAPIQYWFCGSEILYQDVFKCNGSPAIINGEIYFEGDTVLVLPTDACGLTTRYAVMDASNVNIQYDTIACDIPELEDLCSGGFDLGNNQFLCQYSDPITDCLVNRIYRFKDAGSNLLNLIAASSACVNDLVVAEGIAGLRGYTSLVWLDDAGEVAGLTPYSSTNTFEEEGVYTLVVEVDGGCTYEESIPITGQGVRIEYELDGLQLTAWFVGTLTDFTWRIGSGLIFGPSDTLRYTFSQTGTYDLSILSDQSGCFDGNETVTINVDGSSAVKDVTAINVTVWPNPASDVINWRINGAFVTAELSSESGLVNIYNPIGQLVYAETFYPTSNDLGQVSTSNWSKGTYTLVLTMMNGRSVQRRIVVQ